MSDRRSGSAVVSFVIVPQWQGSGSARAMRLVDGAEAIRGDLPSSTTTVVDVPVEAGESQGTRVDRITSLCAIRDRVREALDAAEDPVIVVGGDCGVELEPVSRAVRKLGDRLAVVWLDAHPDLNTPATSASHAFHGMVLRTLLGEGDERLVPEASGRLDPANLILAGTRAYDDAEVQCINEYGIEVLPPDRLADPEALVAALDSRDIDSVYLHVDLDVLDPASIEGIGFPEPFGVDVASLLATIAAVRTRYPLAGAGITEFAPASPDHATADLGTILRIVGALTGPRA